MRRQRWCSLGQKGLQGEQAGATGFRLLCKTWQAQDQPRQGQMAPLLDVPEVSLPAEAPSVPEPGLPACGPVCRW